MGEVSRGRGALLCGVLAYVIFGFSFMFSKTALAVTTPFVLLATRMITAFIVMSLILLTGKVRINIRGKKLGGLLVMAFVHPVAYFIGETYSIKLASTSFVGIVLATLPIASVFFGFVLLRERVTIFQGVCMVMSVVGVGLTSVGQFDGFGSTSALGAAVLLLTVCAGSLFCVLSRKLSGDFSPFERTYIMFALGSVVFSAIALVQCRGSYDELIIAPLMNVDFWIPILYLAVLSSVAAFMMLHYATTYLDVAKVSVLVNITTVVSILAGVVFLSEKFGLWQAVGSVIIIAAAYGVNMPQKSGGSI